MRNQRPLPAPILSSGPFLGQCGSSSCVLAPDYGYHRLTGGHFYRHLPMSHSTERNMSGAQQTTASEEEERTLTDADGPQHIEEEQKNTGCQLQLSLSLFTGTQHGNMPCELQAEEWWLLAGFHMVLG